MPTKIKKLELSAKKLIKLLLENSNEPILVQNNELIFTRESISKILILRHDRIGDILISTPFFKQLRELFPDTQIDVLLSYKNIAGAKAIEHFVNHIRIYKKNFSEILRLMGDIRYEQYDLIIDLFDNESATSSAFIKYSKTKFSLGLQKANENVYTHVVPLLSKNKFHIVERVLNLLLPFGINPSEVDNKLCYCINDADKSKQEAFLSEKSKEFRIGVNLAGSNRNKFWGTQNYIELIKKMQTDRSIEILIFATNDYNAEVTQITEITSALRAFESDSTHEYALQLSTCDMIITPDTSAIHFASAFSIPVIAFYNTEAIERVGLPWYPWKVPYKAFETTSGDITEIKPETVYNGFLDLFSTLREL